MKELEITRLIIDCCLVLGFKKEEAQTVLQILSTVEQRSDMVYWLLRNNNCKVKAIDVIMAASEIQHKHKQLSKMKEVNIPFNLLAECSPDLGEITTDNYGNQVIVQTLSREEVCELMKRNCTDLVLTDNELKTFNAEFTYQFNGYTAISDSDRPLTDCISQLPRFQISGIDHYLIKIWTAPGHKVSAQQWQWQLGGLGGCQHWQLRW